MRLLYSSRRQEDGYIGNSELKSNALLDSKWRKYDNKPRYEQQVETPKVDDTSISFIFVFSPRFLVDPSP